MIKNRVIYIFILIASGLFHIFYINYLSFYILLFFMLLPILSYLCMLPAGLTCKLRFHIENPIVQRNNTFLLHIQTKSRLGLFPTPVNLQFEIQNHLQKTKLSHRVSLLSSLEQHAIEFEMNSPHAGKLSCTLDHINVYEYLGLFSLRRKVHPSVCEVHVLPSVFEMQELSDVKKQHVEEIDIFSQLKPGDDPSEVFDLRAYREGDRLSRVHWKLSSRMDAFIVKEYSLPTLQKPLLVLDFNCSNECLDALLDSAASVSYEMMKQETPHAIAWYNLKQARWELVVIDSLEDFYRFLTQLIATAEQIDDELFTLPELEYTPISLLYYFTSHFSTKNLNALFGNGAIPTVCEFVVSASNQTESYNLTNTNSDIRFHWIDSSNAAESLTSLLIF